MEDILAKSSRLMARKGYRGTTMRDLAQATGRSLAGLYHYFKDKEELLFLINRKGFASLYKSAEAILQGNMSAEQRLHALVTTHVGYFIAHRDEMRVMMFGTHGLDVGRSSEIQELKDRYTSLAQGIVGEFSKAATGRTPGRKELARRTYLLFGMMNWIFGWYDARNHGSEAELIEDIHRTFTRGIVHAD